MNLVSIAEGNGGQENKKLIEEMFFKSFKNDMLQAEDSAIFDSNYAFTTDSFIVNPIFFSGGNIGKLAICGVCNDLAMMGARPKYISFAVILEEGFDKNLLQQIVKSVSDEVCINGAKIITGDTKVAPKGSVDKIFINCSAIGEVVQKNLSSKNLQVGDAIIVSRDIGAHGATIFANREGIDLSSNLQSDCTSLWPIIDGLIESGIKIKCMRDATRGGIAAVLNEWSEASNVCIEVKESKIPVSNEVQGICEMLGFEATSLANEGTFVLCVENSEVQQALNVLRRYEKSHNCSEIGQVTNQFLGKVIISNDFGTMRFLEMPSGELLPRIC